MLTPACSTIATSSCSRIVRQPAAGSVPAGGHTRRPPSRATTTIIVSGFGCRCRTTTARARTRARPRSRRRAGRRPRRRGRFFGAKKLRFEDVRSPGSRSRRGRPARCSGKRHGGVASGARAGVRNSRSAGPATQGAGVSAGCGAGLGCVPVPGRLPSRAHVPDGERRLPDSEDQEHVPVGRHQHAHTLSSLCAVSGGRRRRRRSRLLMDTFALELGIDPTQVRRANFIADERHVSLHDRVPCGHQRAAVPTSVLSTSRSKPRGTTSPRRAAPPPLRGIGSVSSGSASAATSRSRRAVPRREQCAVDTTPERQGDRPHLLASRTARGTQMTFRGPLSRPRGSASHWSR